MKKIALLFMMCPLFAYAQLNASIFSTNNQKLVEEAVASGFFVIRQSYQLVDSTSNQRFGRYGDKDFGRVYALAVRTAHGVVVDGKVMEPWECDVNFQRYRESYHPVLSVTETLEFGDTVFSERHIDYGTSLTMADSLICVEDSSLNAKGFETESFDEQVDGWLVWVTNVEDENGFDGTSPFSYTIYRKSVTFTQDEPDYVVDAPQPSAPLWGGVFVVSEQTAIGQLTFKVVGVLKRDAEDDGWKIVPVTFSRQSWNEGAGQEELTPVDATTNKKKKQKN